MCRVLQAEADYDRVLALMTNAEKPDGTVPPTFFFFFIFLQSRDTQVYAP